MTQQAGLIKLLSIMKRLRDKETGCPWDIKQTFTSLINCTVEEVYEVKEAILENNLVALKEELGDLLFQIVFYAELADELDLFNFNDISNLISEKLIRRHPHVFGNDTTVNTSQNTDEQIKQNWEMIKQQERFEKNQTSLMDDIPKSLPALLRAYKIQKRCKSVGFDWDNIEAVFDKVEEEITEIKETISDGKPTDTTQEELGDLLFAVVNLTRHLGYNPEMTLDLANQKFMKRFKSVEQILAAQGKTCSDSTLDQMEAAWQTVKKLNM